MTKKGESDVVKKTVVTTTTHVKNPPKKTAKRRKKSPASKKKKSTRKTSRSKSSKKTKKTSKKNENIEKMLIENFTSLQGVMTDLSGKFDNLASGLSKLLEIFEKAAKSLMEKDLDIGESKVENKKVAEKLDKLLEHNKTIARSLALLHEGQEFNQQSPQTPQMKPQSPPNTNMPQNMNMIPRQPGMPPQNPGGMSGYQKSISSGNREP